MLQVSISSVSVLRYFTLSISTQYKLMVLIIMHHGIRHESKTIKVLGTLLIYFGRWPNYQYQYPAEAMRPSYHGETPLAAGSCSKLGFNSPFDFHSFCLSVSEHGTNLFCAADCTVASLFSHWKEFFRTRLNKIHSCCYYITWIWNNRLCWLPQGALCPHRALSVTPLPTPLKIYHLSLGCTARWHTHSISHQEKNIQPVEM